MAVNDFYIQNFQLIRTRSMRLWESMEENLLYWRPQPGASSCIEIIRIILESEVLHLLHLLNGDTKDLRSNPLSDLPLSNVENEIKQSQKYREQFLQLLFSLKPEDFELFKVQTDKGAAPVALSGYLLNMMRQESEYYGLLHAYTKLYKGSRIRA